MPLKIATWNANGLIKHSQEIKTYFQSNIVSETHFTSKSYCYIPECILYHTKHPDDKTHGAILSWDSLDVMKRVNTKENSCRLLVCLIEDRNDYLTILVPYSPLKHAIKREHYIILFKTLGNCFIVGNYNAKHAYWGSRFWILSKERELLEAIEAMNLAILPTRESI